MGPISPSSVEQETVPGSDPQRRLVLGSLLGLCAIGASWHRPRAFEAIPPSVRLSRPQLALASTEESLNKPALEKAQSPSEADAPEPEEAHSVAPTFVRRQDWASDVPAANHQALTSVHRVTIHHTGADHRAKGISDLQAVQRIEDYHRLDRGWACIGYHFLIGHDGLIYEGRPLSMQGAHVSDNNEGNIGIACMGAFDLVLPSEAQLQSLLWLVGRIQDRTGIDTTSIYGHRDLSPSTCPGACLYAWLQERLHGPAFG